MTSLAPVGAQKNGMFPPDLGGLVIEEAILDALDVLPARGLPLLSPGCHGLRRPEPERVHRRSREGDTLEGAKHGARPCLSEICIFQSTKLEHMYFVASNMDVRMEEECAVLCIKSTAPISTLFPPEASSKRSVSCLDQERVLLAFYC